MFPQHLKDMNGLVRTVTSDMSRPSLAALASPMLSESVPNRDLSPDMWRIAHCFVIKGWGLATNCSWQHIREMVSNIVSRKVQSGMGEELRPLQVKYGAPEETSSCPRTATNFGLELVKGSLVNAIRKILCLNDGPELCGQLPTSIRLLLGHGKSTTLLKHGIFLTDLKRME